MKAFVVLHRISSEEPWEPSVYATFPERRLAENFIECRQFTPVRGLLWAILEGEIEEQIEVQEAKA